MYGIYANMTGVNIDGKRQTIYIHICIYSIHTDPMGYGIPTISASFCETGRVTPLVSAHRLRRHHTAPQPAEVGTGATRQTRPLTSVKHETCTVWVR